MTKPDWPRLLSTERALREASAGALLRVYAVLTHRMHEARRGPDLDILRGQRDLVEAEIERRMR